MKQSIRPKENYLAVVLALSFVLGMLIAVGVFFAWRSGAIPPGFHHPLSVAALITCPPFILSVAIAPGSETDLGMVLAIGAIVFGNAFLYGGVASGLYFAVSVIVKRRREAA